MPKYVTVLGYSIVTLSIKYIGNIFCVTYFCNVNQLGLVDI